MHCGNAVETRDLASRLFASRDPGMVVTTALCEWRDALDKLLLHHALGRGILLAEVVRQLVSQSVRAMTAHGYWRCGVCWHIADLREITELPTEESWSSLARHWPRLPAWVCAECVVALIRSAREEHG